MKLLFGCALWLTIVATAGCDAAGSRSSPPPKGEARIEKLKTNFTVDEARDIAEPVSETPGLSVDKTEAENMAVGNEVFSGQLEPPKGLKTKRLFDTAAAGDDERFERLEAAMQQLRDDFDAVNPSINRLIAIEREIQTLVDQLNVLVANDGQAAPSIAGVPIPPVPAAMVEDSAEFPADRAAQISPPVPLAPPLNTAPSVPVAPVPIIPVPAPAPEPSPKTPAPAAQPASGKMLSGIRIAEHDKSVRIVFETNAKLTYAATVDPEKILLVTFSEGITTVDAATVKINSTLIKSIDITPQNGGGFIAAMPLAKLSKIVAQGVLAPDASNPNYRIYIDLQK